MARHTTFRYCLAPTDEQQVRLARHAGAARFAFNQCLRMVKTALDEHESDLDVDLPWTGFDLINAFNAWKNTADAGRVFAVDAGGAAEIHVTGLVWRNQVCQQVFEEAAVDCGRALAAWSDSRQGKRKGGRVGFPRFRKKSGVASFRMRNKKGNSGRPGIRVGESYPRSVALPGIGIVRVHDDTRPLRRMVANGRARILFCTVSYRAGRWWISLTVEAANLHRSSCHPARADGDCGGWVGVDRGLSAFLVAATADGRELTRVNDPPRALVRGLQRQRRLANSLSRKKKGSNNRRQAATGLARHHYHVRNVRQHFLHQVANELVKTHDRLVLEDLNVVGMLANPRLSRAISDAAWAEFARLLRYKSDWRNAQIAIANRWYPSSQICSRCGARSTRQPLGNRIFKCGCGYVADRDLNAAIKLARWGEAHHVPSRSPDPQAGGRVTNARRREGTGQHSTGVGETGPNDAGTDVQTAPAG